MLYGAQTTKVVFIIQSVGVWQVRHEHLNINSYIYILWCLTILNLYSFDLSFIDLSEVDHNMSTTKSTPWKEIAGFSQQKLKWILFVHQGPSREDPFVSTVPCHAISMSEFCPTLATNPDYVHNVRTIFSLQKQKERKTKNTKIVYI